MDAATNGMFKNSDIKLVNACRLFLGITMLSDIVTAEGTEIRPEIWQGKKKVLDQHKGLIPYQSKPYPKAWSLWRKLLQQFTNGNTNVLNVGLGRWFVTG